MQTSMKLKPSIIFSFVISLLFLPFFGFSLLEEKVYCTIQEDNIVIFLNEEKESIPCSKYLNLLDYKKNEIFKELTVFAHNIQDDSDNLYWTTLFDEKKQQFLLLDRYKKLILERISIFEKNLFKKCKNFLEEELNTLYYRQIFKINLLEKHLKKIQEESVWWLWLTWSLDDIDPHIRSSMQRLILLQHQRDGFQAILRSSSLEELFNALLLYFSLSWESE